MGEIRNFAILFGYSNAYRRKVKKQVFCSVDETLTLVEKEKRMRTLKGQIQVRGGFIRILVAMVLVVPIFGAGALAEDLLLSEAKDISRLGADPVYGLKPLGSQDIYTATVTYSINVADCALFETMDGYDHLAINGLSCLSNPGQPQLPVKTLTTKLARNAEVLGIEVISGSYHEILNPVDVAPSPQPRIWMRQEDIPKQLRERLKLASLNLAIYGRDEYFPGKIATYSAGRDNDSACVYIKVFPVQCIPKRKKAILVTNAKINIYYSLSPLKGEASAGLIVDPAECVIICPSLLEPAAELLRDFHVSEENVSTSVLTTEDIDAAYSPAADPVYKGYKDDDYAGRDKIVGYDYELAKKIISYLRDQETHPNLKYVTLLGDGLLVPPSYYINEWGTWAGNWESYYDWVPTDFLYTSPDYDFVPNYRVGRLPVSDAAQAESVVSKISSWHSSLSWDWFKRVCLGGGSPFGTIYYYGELGMADLVNKDTFNGMELTRSYYTDGNFDINHIKPFLSTAGAGLLYHVDHGSGYEMMIQDDLINASEVMDYQLNTHVPFVVSVSCINAAYDTDLTKFEEEQYQPQFPEIPYPTSFGEAIILSDAGGIAYVGGSRLNYAGWSIYYDQGRLLANHYYMGQICNSVFESYHGGTSRIGDMAYDALRFYARDNDMSSSTNKETIFGFILLGDPVLTLPPQQPGPSYQKPYLTALDPDRYSGEGIPYYGQLLPDGPNSISVTSSTDSPTVDAKSIYTWSNIIVNRQYPNTTPLTHTFTPTGCGYHLVRSSGEDGKEGWLYLNAQFVFTPTSDLLLVDGDYGADYEKYYTGALEQLGRAYDIWEVGARDPIDAQTLAQYLDGVVIWAIPFSPPPSEEEKAACQFYLDSGGRLFISGQEIGLYLTRNGWQMDYFYENYLHAQFVADDSGIYTLTGIPEDPIGDGLTITIESGDGADNQYWPDEIEPISPAVPVFVYEPGREGALRVDTGAYKVVYFSFGFEGIDSQTDRNEVMKRVLGWLQLPFAEGEVENLTTGKKYSYIQPAIDEATPGDEIVASVGIYPENIDFKGKNLTLRSVNPDHPTVVAATVINGVSYDRVVTFSGGEDANCVLAGFTITGGNTGVYCYHASPTITNCIITGNSAEDYGGGICCKYNSKPKIKNCTISGNFAPEGGGIYYERAGPPPQFEGGMFTMTEGSTFINCVIISNTADYGGGMYNDGGRPTLANCVLRGNSVNYAGGGIYNDAGRPILNNCIFSGNLAKGGGGMLNNEKGNSVLTNCTFNGNSANKGGAIFNNVQSNPVLTNCILWGDTPEEIGLHLSTPVITYSSVQGGWPGLGNIDADPRFVLPGCWTDANNPGVPIEPNDPNAIWIDGNYHLKSEGWRWNVEWQEWDFDRVTSRCIDAGNPGSALGEELMSVPVDPGNTYGQNLRINMGAYGGTNEASMPPYGWAILADLTNDGIVDLVDLAHWAENWLGGSDGSPGDLDRNGIVNMADFALLAQDWFLETTWHE